MGVLNVLVDKKRISCQNLTRFVQKWTSGEIHASQSNSSKNLAIQYISSKIFSCNRFLARYLQESCEKIYYFKNLKMITFLARILQRLAKFCNNNASLSGKILQGSCEIFENHAIKLFFLN